MTTELQRLTITETIRIGTFKIEVNKELKAELIKYSTGEIKVKYSMDGGSSYTTPPVPKEHSRLVWQKAQQQQ